MQEPQLQHKKSQFGVSTIAEIMDPFVPKKINAPLNIISNSDVAMASSMEPGLQRKRKLVSSDPMITMPNAGNEYILLGDQSKFATNIKYRAKSAKRHASKSGDSNKKMVDKCQQVGKRRPQTTEVNPGHEPFSRRRPRPQTVSLVDIPKVETSRSQVLPPPKAVVDTGAPVPRKKSPPEDDVVDKDEAAKEKSPTTANNNKVGHATNGKSVTLKAKPKMMQINSTKEVVDSASKKSKLRVADSSPSKVAERVKETAASPPKIPEEKTKDKVLADNYALKYKAGLTVPHLSKTKLSEYQKQFTWKKGINSSPLLAAEELVYKTNAQVAAPKASKMARNSEYQKAYQPWLQARSVPNALSVSKPTRRLHRSKSVETVNKTIPAGKERVTDVNDKRLLLETTTPVRTRLPQSKARVLKSEYSVNFREPAQYVYENGAWRGAEPIQASSPERPEAVASSSSLASSWFGEVQELRRRAHEYKTRAQGTHFGRAHLAQLYAQQADLWDTASVSSLLSALSLQTTDVESARKTAIEPKISMSDTTDGVQPKKHLAWSQIEDTTSLPSSVTSWKGLVPHKDRDVEAGWGDAPSPQRHHLARTTPAMGGLLLVDHKPNQHGDGPAVEQLVEMDDIEDQDGDTPDVSPIEKVACRCGASRTPLGRPSGPNKAVAFTTGTHRQTPRAGGRPVTAQQPLRRRPTFGVPTRDTHLLMDEQASHDQPLQTEFVQSPLLKKHCVKNAWEDFNVVSKTDERNEVERGTSSAPLVDWKTLTIGDLGPREDDQLSLSVMSVASSCSLASQVLERARHRRDEFWGHQPSQG